MIPGRRISALAFALPLLLGAGYFGSMYQSTEDRFNDLEGRVARLEATVAALSGEEGASADEPETHVLSGVYIERPEQIDGAACSNFYPEGTKVFLTDWTGEVLGSGELGVGTVIEDGLCAQSFRIDGVPERDGYTVNFERRTPGSAYEFTLEELQANDWAIEVRSRYRT